MSTETRQVAAQSETEAGGIVHFSLQSCVFILSDVLFKIIMEPNSCHFQLLVFVSVEYAARYAVHLPCRQSSS